MTEEEQEIREEILEELAAISEHIKQMEADNVYCKHAGKPPMWTISDFMESERDYRHAENELRQIEGAI